MKIYIKSNVINIKLLTDLKEKYEVMYKQTVDTRLILDGDTVIYIDKFGEYFDIDCSHWIDKILEDDNDIRFSDILESIIDSLTEMESTQFN